MKPMFKASLLATTVLLVMGCTEPESNTATTSAAAVETEASAPASRITATTPDEKAAYAMGLYLGDDIKGNLEGSKDIGVVINHDLVLQGINDVFNDTKELTDEQVEKELNDFNARVEQAMADKAKKESAENKAIGDEYRANFEKEEGVQKTESGILYRVVTEGTGDSPTETDGVVVNYEGKLVDGTKFDSSYDRGFPVTFPLTSVIPGWIETLPLMSTGSKFEVVIPPELAYGETPQPQLPGNSTLIFTIELLEVIPQDKIQERMQADQKAQQEAYIQAQLAAQAQANQAPAEQAPEATAEK